MNNERKQRILTKLAVRKQVTEATIRRITGKSTAESLENLSLGQLHRWTTASATQRKQIVSDANLVANAKKSREKWGPLLAARKKLKSGEKPKTVAHGADPHSLSRGGRPLSGKLRLTAVREGRAGGEYARGLWNPPNPKGSKDAYFRPLPYKSTGGGRPAAVDTWSRGVEGGPASTREMLHDWARAKKGKL